MNNLVEIAYIIFNYRSTIFKININLNKIWILYLCSDFPFTMTHQTNLKYYIINMKVDKTCRAIDDMMKKNDFLNSIWSKLCRNHLKFNFILTILKTHKNKTILFILHFSKIFICVKRVNCYFIVFLIFIISRSKLFLKIVFYWIFLYNMININSIFISDCRSFWS